MGTYAAHVTAKVHRPRPRSFSGTFALVLAYPLSEARPWSGKATGGSKPWMPFKFPSLGWKVQIVMAMPATPANATPARGYGGAEMHDADKLEAVLRYHERTKHQFHRYARSAGTLDWVNQPNPFRRYEGAPLTQLPILGADEEPLLASLRGYLSAGLGAERAAHGPLAVAAVRVRACAVGLEAGGRHALGAAQQPFERQPASHRGLPADRRDSRAGARARPVPLRAERARSGTARERLRRVVRAVDARVSPTGLSGRSLVHPLARSVEVRRTRVPLLPARRGPCHRHASHRRRDPGMERCRVAWPGR